MMIGLIVGGLIGLLLRGGILGLVLGAVLGYFLARPIMAALGKTQVGQVRRAFIDSTFAVMGAVCKASRSVRSSACARPTAGTVRKTAPS